MIPIPAPRSRALVLLFLFHSVRLVRAGFYVCTDDVECSDTYGAPIVGTEADVEADGSDSRRLTTRSTTAPHHASRQVQRAVQCIQRRRRGWVGRELAARERVGLHMVRTLAVRRLQTSGHELELAEVAEDTSPPSSPPSARSSLLASPRAAPAEDGALARDAGAGALLPRAHVAP